MPGVITRPEVVCVFSVVVAPVTVGPARVTVIVARGRRPAQSAHGIGRRFLDGEATRGQRAADVGVNFSPAAPWARVMKLPLAIGVVPLFW